MSRIVSESYAILIGVIADDKGTPTVLAKSVPAATPTVETISDGEVSIEEAPAPSASRAPARRNTKGKAKATTQSPELMAHRDGEQVGADGTGPSSTGQGDAGVAIRYVWG